MKLEVGQYVRTKEGITQFKEYDTSNGKLLCMPLMNGTFANIEDVSKASHNIIDLIEVGDYVNGFRVDEIGEYHSIRTDKVEIYAKVNCSALLNCFYEEDIKSIVTKEQFESMSYKVGE